MYRPLPKSRNIISRVFFLATMCSLPVSEEASITGSVGTSMAVFLGSSPALRTCMGAAAIKASFKEPAVAPIIGVPGRFLSNVTLRLAARSSSVALALAGRLSP
ncbi:MAG: hypothetical protein BWY72_02266 [Bacteroidetes bacterium ADurb.Bin416]|nr:MAG: hypothetical protein BWY72_02266 [Bacteroidetes bacterium ADurb.Bin416]